MGEPRTRPAVGTWSLGIEACGVDTQIPNQSRRAAACQDEEPQSQPSPMADRMNVPFSRCMLRHDSPLG